MAQKLTPTKKKVLKANFWHMSFLVPLQISSIFLRKLIQSRLKFKDHKKSTKLRINKLLLYNVFTDEKDLFDVKKILRF